MSVKGQPREEPQESRSKAPSEHQDTEGNVSHVTTTVDLSTGFVFEGFNESMEGVKVDENHENFITAYNMLTGIRFAVSNVTAKNQRPLTSSDFEQTAVYSFNMEQASRSSLFQFKDYMPWVFRHLRDKFGLDSVDYLMSLTSKYIVNELGSPGKSGSFFYYSRDYRFIIKTIHHSEHKRLRQVLYDYYKHVDKNPSTLISQFYGLHRVKLPLGRKIHFVVMNNVFPALYEIHARYDLKGSTLGRAYHGDQSSGVAVYKDLDWIRSGSKINLGPERAEKLKQQLRKDVAFLKRINVMDYSFLVGIHDRNKGNRAIELLRKHFIEFGVPEKLSGRFSKSYGSLSRRERSEFIELQNILTTTNPTSLKQLDFSDDRRAPYNAFYRDHGGYQSTLANDEPADVIYYVGIIDFLTEYNLRKHTETFFKGLRHKKAELSAIPSVEYGDRFLNFVCTSIGPDPRDKTAPAKKNVKSSNQSTRSTYTKPQPLKAPLRPAQSVPYFRRQSSPPVSRPASPDMNRPGSQIVRYGSPRSNLASPRSNYNGTSSQHTPHHPGSPLTSSVSSPLSPSSPQRPVISATPATSLSCSEASEIMSTATSDFSDAETKVSQTTITSTGAGRHCDNGHGLGIA